MRILHLLFILLLIPVCHAASQENERKELIESELKRYEGLRRASVSQTSDQRIDVTYYLLDLQLTTNPEYLSGSVLMDARVTVNDLSEITINLMSSMTVDSVRVGSSFGSFTRGPASYAVTLDRSYSFGEIVTVRTYYRGRPGSSGLGSFEFSSQSGKPWVWTLSEPYGAKDWWPCKDHPMDKADSADIIVRCDSNLKAGSNGKLISNINHGDGTRTFHWRERYPISTYLISLALTNYAEFSHWFKCSPADSMEVLNYVLPSSLGLAQSTLPKTIDMLGIFSEIFGLYPFINEKYGHAQFGWGGAMEHQTMTSTGSFSEYIIAHELAHQWFGDMITCRTWQDLWLNEGFASYSEALYAEQRYGAASYRSIISADLSSARGAVGTLFVQDTANVNNLFAGSRVYSKGSSVLHMLRRVLGDSSFFASLMAYATDPSMKYGTASTADFQRVCETTSGKELDYFFDQWVYGEKYPRYSVSTMSSPLDIGYRTRLTIGQSTGTTNPPYFTMPIDVKLSSTGWDTVITVFNDSIIQSFSFDLPVVPSSVTLDPGERILKEIINPVQVTPAVVAFSSVFLGLEKHDTIEISNLAPDTLFILDVSTTIPDILLAPHYGAIPPGETMKFSVTMSPVSPGMRTGSIYFTHNMIASPLRVGVTAVGIPNTLSVQVKSKWNLLSTPYFLSNPAVTAVIPSVSLPMYYYDADSARYFQDDPLEPGRGYWVKSTSTEAVTFSGAIPPPETLNVVEGWNLIGTSYILTPATMVQSAPPGLTTSPFYRYDGGYETSDTLQPGLGYWIKMQSAGKLILRSSTGQGNSAGAIVIRGSQDTPPSTPEDNVGSNVAPAFYALTQNYPNPFNPVTSIEYHVPRQEFVSLKVFDVLGREVAVLVNGQQGPGAYVVRWDASDWPSGVYYYRLIAGDFTRMRAMVAMK